MSVHTTQSTKVKSTRREGESLGAYKRRIKQEMRDFLTEEIRNQKHVKSKAKQYETYPDMHSLPHEFARAFHILHWVVSYAPAIF